jgi:primosomal protein N' (replication factor Y) (superfamily II helicase)
VLVGVQDLDKTPETALLWSRARARRSPGVRFAQVLVDVPVPGPLEYRVTDEQRGQAREGVRCVVPVGARSLLGVIVGLSAHASIDETRIRPVHSVLEEPLLARDWLQFCRFAAQYYHHSWAEVVSSALPPLLRRVPGPRSAMRLARMRREPPPALHAGAREALVLRDEQRTAACTIVQAGGFAPFLLHGITGSGKTEVYLEAMSATLAADRRAQVLWLVPEINLTPQFETRLQARFATERVASLHSGLAAAERTGAWLAAHEGRARIVLGTRLAVFASMPCLNLVVVDEEHDSSFKASDGVRYCARDLAVKRAQLARCPVVLGSATPSLESWHLAQRGRYRLLRLAQRRAPAEADAARPAAAPQVSAVDLRQHPAQQGLSAPLRAAIDAALACGTQALVFINRRGYAPVLACDACGWLSNCPNCSANAALHRSGERGADSLHCHHCGWSRRVPQACPDCGNQDLKPVGQGTQRVEETLRKAWPASRIARIDRDSARRAGSVAQTLSRVHAGEVDVLVGTQMIAKGHDFQGVSVVGVLNADAQLIASDFRAPERLFALLMQVAGRAGRAGQPARVLVQTRYPGHPLYQALARGDFDQFARGQLAERKSARMPPFAYQALLSASAPALQDALKFLGQCRGLGQDLASQRGVALYDAVPMPMARLASQMRAQLLIEAGLRAPLHAFLDPWLQQLRRLKVPRGLRWQIEVDPLSI